MFRHAITRTPGPDFAAGLTTSTLGKPDYDLMLHQHQAYCDLLRSLGLEVETLEALPGYPDAYFVEDAAVMTPQTAVITHPGAAARRGETAAIQPVLAGMRPIQHIQPPATLDGGDVLEAGQHFFIGLSERTNRQGAEQLGNILSQQGLTWTAVPVLAGLHLKSSVAYMGNQTLLISADLAQRPEFAAYEKIVLDAEEEYAGNSLWINDCLLIPAGFPRTRRKLEPLGLRIIEVDVSEARKMDGGLSCMSLRF